MKVLSSTLDLSPFQVRSESEGVIGFPLIAFQNRRFASSSRELQSMPDYDITFLPKLPITPGVLLSLAHREEEELYSASKKLHQVSTFPVR